MTEETWVRWLDTTKPDWKKRWDMDGLRAACSLDTGALVYEDAASIVLESSYGERRRIPRFAIVERGYLTL